MGIGMGMKIWIRHLDCTVEDFGRASEADALRRFQSHDWDAELEGYDPDKDGPDHCMPAFGIVDGEDASCDITPFNRSDCKVNLYFHKPRRLFGVLPITKNVWEHLPVYRRGSAGEIFKLFYARDIEGLSRLILKAKGREA